MTDPIPISADDPRAVWRGITSSSCRAAGPVHERAVLTIAVSALAGQALAEDKSLATVPFVLQFVMTMISTIPSSMLMGKIGRRAGFTIGQIVGIIGALIAAFGLFENSFPIFCVGSAVIGIHNAFWSYLRFAAADVADADFRPTAISYVMAGGWWRPSPAQTPRRSPFGGCFRGSYRRWPAFAFSTSGCCGWSTFRPAGGGRPAAGPIARNVSVAVAAADRLCRHEHGDDGDAAGHARGALHSDSAFVISGTRWECSRQLSPDTIHRYAAPR